MKVSTFQEDLLELQDFAKRLGMFVDTEHDFVEGSLVIALSSKFGSGKSTFLNMWQSALEEAEGAENKPLVISLNAWEGDYNGDSLFSIVSALAEAVQRKGEAATPLLEAAKDFGWFMTSIGSQLASKFVGMDPVVAGKFSEKKKGERLGRIQGDTDAFSVYEGRKNAMESLKKAIEEMISSSSPRAIFLVDELDRCRPDYAISYLETIKHIFDIKGAVFILAIDRQQLENSAKTAFGLELDFEEYFRKFVHREVSLPPISDNGYRKLARKYVSHYLEGNGSRFCFMELGQHRIDNISDLIGALKLTPRQIQEVFRMLGHILSTSDKNRGNLLFCLGVGSIAMAVFKIGAPQVFHSLGTQQLDPVEAVTFIKNTIGELDPEWWFSLFLTGGGLYTKEGESVTEVMRRVGLIHEGADSDYRRDLSQWYGGWGHGRSNGFKQIYEKIQHISQWS